jgi:hypothetical protein
MLRTPVPDDEPYVMSSMVRTVLGIGGQPPPAYAGLDRRATSAIERELRRRWRDPAYVRVVACPTDDPWLVAGFIIGRPGVLTYLNVRSGFTGLGLATALLGGLGIDRDAPAAVEFDTWDLSRPVAGRDFPIGLLNSGRWPRLTLVPWSAERP